MNQTEQLCDGVYMDTRGKLECYTSIIHVLDKLEQDTHLGQITYLFSLLINQEISFVIQGNITRTYEVGQFK